MVAWPDSLPQKQFLGLTDQIDDPIARTPMDTGPSTRRRRFTAVTRSVTVPIILNGTQRQTFDSFFNTDLKYGELTFTWEDPVTDATITFAFKSPPQWAQVQGGSIAGRVYQANLELEIQP